MHTSTGTETQPQPLIFRAKPGQRLERRIEEYITSAQQQKNLNPADLSFIHDLRRIEAFVQFLETTGPEVCLLDQAPPMRPRTHMVRLEQFFKLRVFDVSSLAAFNGKVVFSDRVQLFLEVVEHHKHRLYRAMAPEGTRVNAGSAASKADIQHINAVIQELRERVRATQFRRRLARTAEQSKRNLIGMQALVNGLFERYARLLVVRIDLSYLKAVHEENHRIRRQDPILDVKMALQHRDTLLNNRRHKPAIFAHCVGYIMQLEQGVQGGCHFHAFFFYNGSKVQSDFHYGQLIGAYWRDDITQGKGLYHLCHTWRATDRVMGVGLIEYTDQKKRDALMNDALPYLVKDEQLIMVKPLKRIAALTHSHPPKDRPKRGPKRQQQLGREPTGP